MERRKIEKQYSRIVNSEEKNMELLNVEESMME